MFIFGRAKAAALLNLRYYPAAIGSAFRKCVGDAYHGRVRFTARLKKKKKKIKRNKERKKEERRLYFRDSAFRVCVRTEKFYRALSR